MNVDEMALKSVQAIGSIDPDKLPGGKTQATAQAQCLIIDAIKNSGDTRMKTKRGDMPASPQSIAQSIAGGVHLSSEYGLEGMTIRERFTMAAMQALITANPNLGYSEVSHQAIVHADNQLAELENFL